jgi:DNA-binding XRE family transcriptional regulator
MRLAGRVFRVGRYWAVEVPMLGVVTQGRTRKEAFEMIADAVETLANKRGFRVAVFPGDGEYFEVGSRNAGVLTALLLRRLRAKQGLTLSDLATRLGARSLNSYARYEQGRAVPSIERLDQLLAAVSDGGELVLGQSRGKRAKRREQQSRCRPKHPRSGRLKRGAGGPRSPDWRRTSACSGVCPQLCDGPLNVAACARDWDVGRNVPQHKRPST